jgi:hypothetical protein
MYISFGTDKDCGLLEDRPVLSTGRTPYDITKPQLSWLQPKSGHESWKGAQSQDCLTDRPTDRPSVRPSVVK